MAQKILRPILYSAIYSPPSCSVRMTAKAIGVDLNVKNLNIFEGEHLTDEYAKINPQRTVPLLDDDGFILWDSHAIMTYLVGKYGKNDELYPQDLKKRAVIDQRLHYESGILFAHLRTIGQLLFYQKSRSILPDSHKLLDEAYRYVNTILKGKKWLAGDTYTLADISSITTIGNLTAFTPINDCPNLTLWIKNCEKELPGYQDIAAPGIRGFHGFVKSLLN